jgi:hypothetical protein
MNIATAAGYAVGTTKAIVRDLWTARPTFSLKQMKADYKAGVSLAAEDNSIDLYKLSPEELAAELKKLVNA